jgi:hypothetical protein
VGAWCAAAAPDATFGSPRETAAIARNPGYFGRGRSPDDVSGWPAVVPPFIAYTTSAVVPTNDGRLFVRRTRSAGHEETRYLVIDRQGRLEGEVTLPTNQHVVGFGTRTVYVVETDDDDIQRIRRHPWP